MRPFVLVLSLLWHALAHGDATPLDVPACKVPGRLGTPGQVARPVLDDSAEPTDALVAWRDALLAAYASCALAPFEARAADLRGGASRPASTGASRSSIWRCAERPRRSPR